MRVKISLEGRGDKAGCIYAQFGESATAWNARVSCRRARNEEIPASAGITASLSISIDPVIGYHRPDRLLMQSISRCLRGPISDRGFLIKHRTSTIYDERFMICDFSGPFQ